MCHVDWLSGRARDCSACVQSGRRGRVTGKQLSTKNVREQNGGGRLRCGLFLGEISYRFSAQIDAAKISTAASGERLLAFHQKC